METFPFKNLFLNFNKPLQEKKIHFHPFDTLNTFFIRVKIYRKISIAEKKMKMIKSSSICSPLTKNHFFILHKKKRNFFYDRRGGIAYVYKFL